MSNTETETEYLQNSSHSRPCNIIPHHTHRAAEINAPVTFDSCSIPHVQATRHSSPNPNPIFNTARVSTKKLVCVAIRLAVPRPQTQIHTRQSVLFSVRVFPSRAKSVSAPAVCSGAFVLFVRSHHPTQDIKMSTAVDAIIGYKRTPDEDFYAILNCDEHSSVNLLSISFSYIVYVSISYVNWSALQARAKTTSNNIV